MNQSGPIMGQHLVETGKMQNGYFGESRNVRIQSPKEPVFRTLWDDSGLLLRKNLQSTTPPPPNSTKSGMRQLVCDESAHRTRQPTGYDTERNRLLRRERQGMKPTGGIQEFLDY